MYIFKYLDIKGVWIREADNLTDNEVKLGWIEKLLAVWIVMCIIIGLAMGKYLPELSNNLNLGIPIGLFLMIYPAMTKIELGELRAGTWEQETGRCHRLLQLRRQPIPTIRAWLGVLREDTPLFRPNHTRDGEIPLDRTDTSGRSAYASPWS